MGHSRKSRNTPRRGKGTVCTGCRGVANPQHLVQQMYCDKEQHQGVLLDSPSSLNLTTVPVKIHLNAPFLHKKEDMRPSGEAWSRRAAGTLRAGRPRRALPSGCSRRWAGPTATRELVLLRLPGSGSAGGPGRCRQVAERARRAVLGGAALPLSPPPRVPVIVPK